MLVGIQEEILRLHSMGLLKQLLVDKTTKANLIWATDAYQELGSAYERDKEMQVSLITGQKSDVIKNRARKAMEQQSERTRKHAEVFTPLWICQKMVSHADAIWFGGSDGFLDGDQPVENVIFSEQRTWQQYVDAKRLEITCGEAPYLVNRYDVSTGEIIPLEERQGVLDRKLRVVNENISEETDWITWVLRAFQATYGYEFQGDNVLIARVNLLMTFEEYLKARWNRNPTAAEYREIIKTIVWNIWQMDGLSGTIPYCKAEEEYHQFSLFEWFDTEEYQEKINQQPHCRIYNWRGGGSLEYQNVNKGGKRNMKFDFLIGNPPYQDDINEKGDRANPIYNEFMNQSFEIADVVELITPARFLFNAGQTPKAWNEKMLQDEHFKVLYYEADATKIFPNTDIKGGVAITLRDAERTYGAIDVFTAYPELNDIVKKVKNASNNTAHLDSIVSPRGNYRTTDKFGADYPDALGRLGKGTGNMLVSNFFEKIPEAIENSDNNADCIKIFCRLYGKRTFCDIRREYIKPNDFINGYNVASPEANASGKFGEKLTEGEILAPAEGATDTFLSIGSFKTEIEALALKKYMKTKLFRTLLGVKKVTQHCPPAVWETIPLQDFTPTSDIDWSQSIADIDRQLYRKYGLDDDEIKFIETHVKEMV